jgi:hypothetical protein
MLKHEQENLLTAPMPGAIAVYAPPRRCVVVFTSKKSIFMSLFSTSGCSIIY